ncbi:MAG: DNA cytosine methyltransferase, partial [Thermomicrobiales bacterium]|nr:DNA cytosine methyltransferase [Thermomicrobiales bacterium]
MAVSTLNVLSLCAGVGGLDLGIRLARPDARTVCYVEWNHFAASVIAARAQDGGLDDAPVWDDVGTFDGEPWRGVVDCVAAGFPCQPVSLAGKRQGMADERFIWGDIERIIGEVAPRYVFLENVPGILSADDGWFLDRVLFGLVALGFDCEWDLFSATETGAPHRRERWFCLAKLADAWGMGPRRDTISAGRHIRHGNDAGRQEEADWAGECRAGMAQPTGDGLQVGTLASRLRGHVDSGGDGSLADAPRDLRRAQRHGGRIAPDGPGDRLGDPERDRLQGLVEAGTAARATQRGNHGLADADQQHDDGRRHEGQRRRGELADRGVYPPARNDVRGWAELIAADPSLEPAVCRDADGLAAGVDA